MTRFTHDQFAKDYLKEILSLLGNVEVSRELKSEPRQADIWFIPAASPGTSPQLLGLLGQMAANPCLIEPFREPASKLEIRDCLGKLFSFHRELIRKAKRDKGKLAEEDLPALWILVPSASGELRKSFGAVRREPWQQGVYLFPEGYRTGLVVLNQLPKTEDTLWLRILSRGRTQKQALKELDSLPIDHPLKENVEEILSSWRTILEEKINLTEEEADLFMNLSATYLRRKQEWIEEGKQEGQRLVIENLLRVRFGELDKALAAIVEPMLKLPTQEYTALLLQLSSLSREELLARFGQ
jgi:hypothetical protein